MSKFPFLDNKIEIQFLLRDLQNSVILPKLAVGDGAMGFLRHWKTSFPNEASAGVLGSQDGQCSHLPSGLSSGEGQDRPP